MSESHSVGRGRARNVMQRGSGLPGTTSRRVGGRKGRAERPRSRDDRLASGEPSTSEVPLAELSSTRSEDIRSDLDTKREGRGDASTMELSKPVGRGGTRGKRTAPLEIIKTRPEMCVSKKGTHGKQIRLSCNYFAVNSTPDWVIFQYRVDFNVEEEREFVKKAWLREHVKELGKAYIFDGSMLFSCRRLTQDNQPLVLTSIRESDRLPVQIEIRLVNQIGHGNPLYLQVFNILLRRSLSHLKMQLVNRSYFDANASIHLTQYNMELWPGYKTAIGQHENNILMCADIAHKLMRNDTALELLAECVKQGGDYQSRFQKAVIGEIVVTEYNNKTYRVHDVDFVKNPNSKFKMSSGEDVSYVDYYFRKYGVRIRDLRQPLLISRASDKSIRGGMATYCLLLPELCRMTGLSSSMREDNRLMRGVADYTRVNPVERIERLKRFNLRLLSKKEVIEEFSNWELKLSNDLLSVPARELPPEMIIAGNGEKYSAGFNTDWTSSLRSKPMLQVANLKEWAVVCPVQYKSGLTGFLDVLSRAASGMNFRIPKPHIYSTNTDRPMHLVEAVEDLIGRARLDLIMFICGNNRADRYNAIKKKCYVDRGIQSQVVLAKNLVHKGVMSIATKIAIQINCKLGGAPWSVEVPMQGVMTIGYDVCHDPLSRDKSYSALVASLNKAHSAWFSTVNNHSSGEELSNTLALDVCKSLRKYQSVNEGALPTRIFIYRDGVGEGQINYVYEHEVKILKQRLTEMYQGESWRLGYIIVSKRINTRLFKGDRNPIPGTVVDDVITLPQRYDFFLVSQNVNSGTVTPTNYNVISDNLDMPPDRIQRWTYKLTHLYYNWSGTVRVPAPCQYAHKLAFLVSQSLRTNPHPNLDSTLYFL